MGLTVAYTDEQGVYHPEAYLRLHAITLGTINTHPGSDPVKVANCRKGEVISYISDNANDTNEVTVRGSDALGDPQTETVSLTGTTGVTGTATWAAVDKASVNGLHLGVVKIGNTSPARVCFEVTPTIREIKRGGLVVTFYVYATLAARAALSDERGTVRVRLALVDIDTKADLMAQAWVALKSKAAFSDGVDVVD